MIPWKQVIDNRHIRMRDSNVLGIIDQLIRYLTFQLSLSWSCFPTSPQREKIIQVPNYLLFSRIMHKQYFRWYAIPLDSSGQDESKMEQRLQDKIKIETREIDCCAVTPTHMKRGTLISQRRSISTTHFSYPALPRLRDMSSLWMFSLNIFIVNPTLLACDLRYSILFFKGYQFFN